MRRGKPGGGGGDRRFQFGITIARPNWRALCGSTLASVAPSRRCKCQSSGRVMVMLSWVFEVGHGGGFQATSGEFRHFTPTRPLTGSL
jgi:hypothetical protein